LAKKRKGTGYRRTRRGGQAMSGIIEPICATVALVAVLVFLYKMGK